MLLWLTLIASAADAPSAATHPDPVLDQALLDVRSTRKAQVGLVIAAASGPLLVAGGIGYVTYVERTDVLGARLSIGMVGAGLVGFLAGPPLLAAHSLRSRNALRRQGLDVSPAGGWLCLGLYASTLVIGGASLSASPYGWLPPLGLYAGAIASGAVQLRTNHNARRSAGWLGSLRLTPWTDGTSSGFAVVSL